MMNFATCVFIAVFTVYNVNCFNQCTAPFSPHPTDCNKFFMCDHGQLVLKSCGIGTHWNARLQTCDWPENARCQSGGGYPNYPGYPTNEPGNYPSNNGPIQFPPNQPSYPGSYPSNQPTPGYPGRPSNQPSSAGGPQPYPGQPSYANHRPFCQLNEPTYPSYHSYSQGNQQQPFNPTQSGGNPYQGQGQNWNGQSTASYPGQNNYNGGFGK